MERLKLDYDITDSNYTSQSEAILQLVMGRNVFLSGPAGSGKSYVIRQYTKLLREINPEINIYKTSTTGLSAFNISGETIHSYSGQGISPKSYKALKRNHSQMAALWSKSAEKIANTDVLIIDEVSMLSEAALQFLYERMKSILGIRFNQVQVIVAGDFSQLAPVASQETIEKYGEAQANYCYGTPAWDAFNFTPCYLDRIYRAKDTRLQFVLDKITNGEGNTEEVKQILRTLPQKTEAHIPGTPTLLPTNKQVAKTNKYWQQENNGHEFFFETEYDDTKQKKLAVKMAKERDAEKEIRLRVGDTIMITANDSSGEHAFAQVVQSNGTAPTLKNGMIGTFTGILGKETPDTKKATRMKSTDKLLFEYEAYGHKFVYAITARHEVMLNSKDLPIAGFTQYPVKLAYAISIHKSQGQTFSKIAIDLNNCWRPGLGYVALSRATNITGITLINKNPTKDPWNYKALQVDNMSTLIKRHILREARQYREVYPNAYRVVADDPVYVIGMRTRVDFKTMMTLAAERYKHNQEKDKANAQSDNTETE